MQITVKSIHKPFLQEVKSPRTRKSCKLDLIQNGSNSQTLMCWRILTGMLTGGKLQDPFSNWSGVKSHNSPFGECIWESLQTVFSVVISLQCVSNSPESVITTQVAEIQCQSSNQFPDGLILLAQGHIENHLSKLRSMGWYVLWMRQAENHRRAEGLCSKISQR